jgi:molecular chaperone GrpE
MLDDGTKQALLSRFRAYLDTAEVEPEPHEQSDEAADLYSVFVELAGLRSEVRTESRLVKDALDQFRAVFDALQTSHAGVQQALDRARADTRDQVQAALKPLLLDIIDLRDRLLAALTLATPVKTAPTKLAWTDRFWRRRRVSPPALATGGETWHEGLRMTLRRLDQILLDRRVVPVPLVGKPFDPRRARVVATSSNSVEPDGTVIEEVRSGFLWEDQVLRTAEVIVSKNTTPKGERL